MATRIKKENRLGSSRMRYKNGRYISTNKVLFDRLGAIVVLLVGLWHVQDMVREYEDTHVKPARTKIVELQVKAGELERKNAQIKLKHINEIESEKEAIALQIKAEEIANRDKIALASLNEYERAIIEKESSFRTTAKNPKSTAFGLWQGLQSTREKYANKYGYHPNTVSAHEQIKMFRGYVSDRYGTPQRALSFHEQMGWY